MLYKIIGNENIKPHYCNDLVLANSIVENLEQRYPNGSPYYIQQIPEDSIHLNFLYQSTLNVNRVYNLESLRLVVKSNDVEMFKNQVKRDFASNSAELYNNKFHKLHLDNFCICLSDSQKELLQNLIFTN